MPTTLPHLSDLQNLLDHCSGIFDVDADILQSLILQEIAFKQSLNGLFPNTDAFVMTLPIQALKNNIQNFSDEGFTHLSINFSLESANNSPNSRNVLGLIMTGVTFDQADPAKMPRSSAKHFTNVNTLLSNNNSQKQANKDNNARFKKRLSPQPFSEPNFNYGLYIRLSDFLAKLNDLDNQSVKGLDITMGLIKAETMAEWNCLHLIFRRSKGAADILFSTYDGYKWRAPNAVTKRGASELGGPKLGTPPFGETLL